MFVSPFPTLVDLSNIGSTGGGIGRQFLVAKIGIEHISIQFTSRLSLGVIGIEIAVHQFSKR